MGRMITLRRRYDIEAAHRLTAGVPEKHKCRRLHGHRYEVTIWISGEPDDNGMLVEYDDLDRVVIPVLKHVDHHDLNTLSERCSSPQAALVSQNPTVERLVDWLAFRLALVASIVQERRMHLDRVCIAEDRDSAAEWSSG